MIHTSITRVNGFLHSVSYSFKTYEKRYKSFPAKEIFKRHFVILEIVIDTFDQ